MLYTLLHKYLRIPYALHVHVVRKPRQARATVLFLHGIGTSGAAWDDVVKGLPKDVAVIAVDLLGFGKSPSPEWAKYSAATQARSLIATLLRLNIRQRLIIVGHSMGALVAVETANRLFCAARRFTKTLKRGFCPTETVRSKVCTNWQKTTPSSSQLLRRWPLNTSLLKKR
jgi:hypothetical protein